MEVILENITEDKLGILRNLFELGAYDLSELNQSDINENGQFLSSLNHIYWHEDPNYDLLFIRVDGILAGFVVIKFIVEEDIYYLNHFFILRKFRRKNIGKEAAIMAFNLYAGNWRVSEFDWNLPAQIFWKKVIKDYTNNHYNETRRRDDKGPAQEFSNYNVQTYDNSFN
jgi:predicted acetyltransferase